MSNVVATLPRPAVRRRGPAAEVALTPEVLARLDQELRARPVEDMPSGYARPVYDHLMTAGQALRLAQIGALEGRPAQVPRATEAHRKAVAGASAAAGRLAKSGAVSLQAEPLLRMLEALSLAREQPEQPGRFTDLVQPSGFEALSGVSPARAATPSVERPATTASRDSDHIERQRTRDAERRRAVQAVADAEAALGRAREIQTQAEKEAAAAEKRLGDARTALDRVRETARAAERTLADARSVLARL